MSSEGWIKLFRQIQLHPLWTKHKFSPGQAWIDLLLLASHRPHKVIQSDSVIPVGTGEILTSQVNLAKRWKWDRRTVRRFIRGLELDQMCAIKRCIKGPIGYTLITITNYKLYQHTHKKGAHLKVPTHDHLVPIYSPFSTHDQECKERKEGKEQRSLHGNPCSIDELVKETIPDGVYWSTENGLQISEEWRLYLSDYLIRYSNALDLATKKELRTRLSFDEAQGVIEYINERLLNDSRLRATEKSKPAKWKQFRAFIRNQFTRSLIQKRQRERSYTSKKAISPDAMGVTGESKHKDYTEEIAECVAKYGEDIHKTENLITSGKRSLTRYCKKQCGFFKRKK